MAIFCCNFCIIACRNEPLHGVVGFLGNIAFYGAIAITILALVFLTNQILAKIPGIDAIVKMVRNIGKRLGISREINLLFHTLSPIIVVCVFLHVLLIPSFNHNTQFMLFSVGYFIIFAVFYIYYGIICKLRVAHYTVENIQMMNDNSFELTLKYSYGKKIKAKGGQFIFIQLPFCKIDEYHPFSILQSLNQDKIIKLGIKKSGDFTDKLANASKETTVKVKGIYGHFTSPKDNNPVLAIAGGIGITPCIGLLQSLSQQRKGYLLWSVSSKNNIIFNEEIQTLVQTHPNIKIIYHDTSKHGYLNSKVLKENINELTTNKPIDCFICGPAPMSKSVIHNLESLGVSDNRILSEGFIF